MITYPREREIRRAVLIKVSSEQHANPNGNVIPSAKTIIDYARELEKEYEIWFQEGQNDNTEKPKV